MSVINIKSHNTGEADPDLGKVSGQSHHIPNRLRSSNSVVQNAMDSLDYFEDGTRSMLQQELGLNPPREMIDFFRNLSIDNKKEFLRVWKILRGTLKNKTVATSLGLMDKEDLIKQKNIEIGRLRDELDATVAKTNTKIQQFNGELTDFNEKIKNALSAAQTEVSQNIKDVRSNAEGQISSFLTSHAAKVEEMESQIKGILAKATVTTLSSKYDEKRKMLDKNYCWAKGIFYACLCAFCVIGLLAAHNVSGAAGSDIMEKIVRAMLTNAPYYLPLFWFTCHMNKLMNQNRRLMEEYAHKVAVAQTYVGMAEQVEELLKKGVKDADNLSAELMDDTIKVLCANPNECLDKVKSSTPISEVVDNVSKLIRATAELKQTANK